MNTVRVVLLAIGLTIVAPLATSFLVSEAPAARAAAARARSRRKVTPLPRPQTPRRSSKMDELKFLRHVMPRLGSDVAFRKVAQTLGVTEYRGKRIGRKPIESSSGSLVMPMAIDQPVDSFDGSQNQPSIAADPTDESSVVVFAQNESNFLGVDVACSIYVSFDAGVTYSYADDVPLVNVDDTCADPVVRFSPDGLQVYYSYLSIRNDGTSSDIVVSIADGDDPATIVTGPTVVIPGGADIADKPWLAVHTFDAADGNPDGAPYVYVAGTVFQGSDCSIVLNASDDYGVTWFSRDRYGPQHFHRLRCRRPAGAASRGGPGPAGPGLLLQRGTRWVLHSRSRHHSFQSFSDHL